MRATVGNLDFALRETAELCEQVHPALSARLLHFARQIELAAAMARQSPRVRELNPDDGRLVDLVSRVEAALADRDARIADLEARLDRLQAHTGQ